ncbi:hypothetical protein LEN26_010484 [Aphanomyces euteiches]|nr:hypothetical protein AeMF1_012672 [Aphanomyces euteiches]KAH9121880.1 hypothetical protein LEN26_010484 [Aphanomyces euteiches]KAH9189400.1 hypothetical protein AeNC1_008633 [Aphanomyces euteiches]
MHAEVEREVGRLRQAIRDLDKNVSKLSRVNNQLVAFNHSFGTLLTAISLQKTCVELPLPSPPPKKVVPFAPMPSPPVVTAPRPSEPSPPPPPVVSKIPVLVTALPPKADRSKPRSKIKPPKPIPPRTFKWPMEARAKIPPKYQPPPELAKLERVLFILGDSLRGMSIGELVRASNIGVVQAKDMLNTLTKIEMVKCKREKQGFVYTLKK